MRFCWRLDLSGCDHFDWRHLQGHKSKPLDLRHEVVSLHVVDAGSAWLSRMKASKSKFEANLIPNIPNLRRDRTNKTNPNLIWMWLCCATCSIPASHSIATWIEMDRAYGTTAPQDLPSSLVNGLQASDRQGIKIAMPWRCEANSLPRKATSLWPC